MKLFEGLDQKEREKDVIQSYVKVNDEVERVNEIYKRRVDRNTKERKQSCKSGNLSLKGKCVVNTYTIKNMN